MTLFSAIQSSSNALRVDQLGLQVVGNNISNVNTPGYIRQQLVQAPGAGYKYGNSVVGQGVVAVGVQQQVDKFVLERLRSTDSQLTYQQTVTDGLSELQDALNELGDNDISSSLSRFSNSLQDIANNPQSNSIRTLAIQRGQELATAINALGKQIDGVSDRATRQIAQTSDEINRLTSSIASLNQRITEVEGGGATNSDAVGLRDERIQRLNDLAKLVNIDAAEQSDSSVTVIVGGDYLVANGLSRKVYVAFNDNGSERPTEIRLRETDAPLNSSSGKLPALYEQRSGVIGDFSNRLDDFSRNIAQVVNRIHSQGQGAVGFQSIRSETVLTSPASPLEQAGENLIVDNGSFQINVRNASSTSSKTYNINVRQLGDSGDTTAAQIASQIDAVDGLHAFIGNDGRLQINSDSSAISFTFAQDSSGALSALGINTFFTGSTARDLAVKSELVKDPSLLAISLDGPGSGAENAITLTSAFTDPQSQLGNLSLQEVYEQMVGQTAQHISSQQTITDGLENFRNTLEARHLGVSGVNLDEEAAKLLLYQRAFQASSRVISVANDLLESLVNLV